MFLLALSLLTASVNGCLAHQGTTATLTPYWEKVCLSDSLDLIRKIPSLATNVSLTSLVARGMILASDSVQLAFDTGIAAIEEKSSKMDNGTGTQPMIGYTVFTLQVDESLSGADIRDQTIQVYMVGGPEDSVTKPHVGDEVVLFLAPFPFADPAVFITCSMEHSIFTVRPDGTLYAFSNTRELSSFDGKPVSALKEAIGLAAGKG